MVSYLSFDEIPPDIRPVVERLNDLATDLHWTWHHGGDLFWREIDPHIWDETRNPYVVMQNLSIQRLRDLNQELWFKNSLNEMISNGHQYRHTRRWGHDIFHTSSSELVWPSDARPKELIAYFSMEFGLGTVLPLYAGGLGVLAGDYLKTASDLGVPVIGISLLFHEGYFRQMIDIYGDQQEIFAHVDSRNLPIKPLSLENGGWLTVPVEFPGRKVYFRVWEARIGCVRLYLLDSNDPLNSPRDQGITSRLYGGSNEERLMQEIALGVAGWRLLGLLNAPIKICHLNEGHAAFATIERARQHMLQNEKISFWEALWATRAGNIFTTHTPMPAAFDVFPSALLEKYGAAYALGLHLLPSELAGLGRVNPHDETEDFNMAFLAMRTCAHVNGVSELHGRVSRNIFRNLYPEWPEDQIPIGHVTNGVHMPTWDSPWSDKLWTEACGKDRWRKPDTDLGNEIGCVTNESLWEARGRERADLVSYVRKRYVRQLAIAGGGADSLKQASVALDANVLTLGFARRFTEYKRPNLLLSDPERLVRLLTHPDHPVQMIVAGKAHPDDIVGKRLLKSWYEFSMRPDLSARVVFLEDYDISLAQELVRGVDVWVNTPRRPCEACGTSGMKVLVNGGLNISTLDGWWAEAYKPEYGWAFGDDNHIDLNASHTDADDALALYEILERSLVPEFYRRDSHGIPQRWIERVRQSMTNLARDFSANRMVRQYCENYYVPAIEAFNKRTSDGSIDAIKCAAWASNLRAHWSNIHWGDMVIEQHQSTISIEVPCYLGDIEPEEIRVELYADPSADEPGFLQKMERTGEVPGAKNSFLYSLVLSTRRKVTDFTPRLIPDPGRVNVPAEISLISWWHGERRWGSGSQAVAQG